VVQAFVTVCKEGGEKVIGGSICGEFSLPCYSSCFDFNWRLEKLLKTTLFQEKYRPLNSPELPNNERTNELLINVLLDAML